MAHYALHIQNTAATELCVGSRGVETDAQPVFAQGLLAFCESLPRCKLLHAFTTDFHIVLSSGVAAVDRSLSEICCYAIS